MSRLFRLARFVSMPLISVALAFSVAGCRNNPGQVQADNNQAGTQDTASDPAAANLPPVADNSNAPQYASNAGSGYQQSGYQEGASGQDQSSYDPGYGEQPEYTDAQPPPPLPDYDQPPAPGDGYIWTPGYWAWSQDGYYWVPGAWVEAPYEGALWTPGYWGYWHNSYGFYPGHWGQYIGYYGGVNYGYGYIGYGYQGGYWGGGHFNYNRSVNNINISVVHNVYSRPVEGNRSGSHVSYNGGLGGIEVRARPAELAAMRQPHTAPMSTQVQNQRAAGANRAQFASANHGRPTNVTVSQPLAADRNVRTPPALQTTNRAVAQQQQRQTAPQEKQREAAPQAQQHAAAPQEQQHQAASPQQQRQLNSQQQQQHQAAAQPQQHPAVPQPQQHRTAPQPQHQAAPQQQQHQAAPHQAAQPPQQHQAAPAQEHRTVPPPPRHQAASQQQHKAAPPPQHSVVPHQAAPAQQQRQEDSQHKEEPPK